MIAKLVRVILLFFLLLSCNRKPAPSVATTAEEPPKRSITDWTSKTELYLEYPALVAGKTGRFAVHLTRLDNFHALKSGRVEVVLKPGDGAVSTFTTTGPSSPGIFGVDVKPGAPGAYQMSLAIAGPEMTDTHELGQVTVFADEKSAAEQPLPKPKEETLAFLKEQQWSLDFATEVARERTLRDAMKIPAQIIPRAGGEAEVTVPFDGQLVTTSSPPPGTQVQKDQVLAQLVPPTSTPSERANLELARAEAEAALNLANKDSQRARRLVDAGAAPARRLEEAQTVELTASARLQAAQARIAQYETTRSATTGTANAFSLRAPITGIVAASHATSGANVKAGEVLYQLVDVASVYAAGKLPESELYRLSKLTGAQLEIPGSERLVPLQSPVSLGRLVDAASRTVNIIYAVDNQSRLVAVGQAVSLRLLTTTAVHAVAIPESAVVDDAGRPLAFVHVSGESFARRPLTLGTRDSGYVEVRSGIRAGERVVVRGAYLIRLSAMSSQIPAHGHVH